jgi:NADH-quinone oxidoreductase subunit C
MSEENKQSSSTPTAAPSAAKAEPPAPPPLGECGQLLEAQKLSIKPLGEDGYGIEMIEVESQDLLAVGKFLKEDRRCQFDLLVSVSGVDRKTHREVVYHLYSLETHKKLVLKVTAVNDRVPSLMSVWNAADWHERETYDLYGVLFDGHPNLTRILMPTDWIGHPLRKDYVVNDPRLVWNER